MRHSRGRQWLPSSLIFSSHPSAQPRRWTASRRFPSCSCSIAYLFMASHPAVGGRDLLTLCWSSSRRASKLPRQRRWWQTAAGSALSVSKRSPALEVNVHVMFLGLLLQRISSSAGLPGHGLIGASRDGGAGGGGDAVGGVGSSKERGWQRWVHVGRTPGDAQGAAEGARGTPLLARYARLPTRRDAAVV